MRRAAGRGGAIALLALFVASCASVPEVSSPETSRERIDRAVEALAAIGGLAGPGVSEVLVFAPDEAVRGAVLSTLPLPKRVVKRLDRACVVSYDDGTRSIWLDGRFGRVAVSVAMARRERVEERSWRIDGAHLTQESRRVLRIDADSNPPIARRRVGDALFESWETNGPDATFALVTRDRSRLPAELEEAQTPFVPEEVVAVAWPSPDGALVLALRTRFAEERGARVALVATRLGARGVIERFALETTEEFAIDRTEREIEIVGVRAPRESILLVVGLIEGGEW